MAHAMQNGEHTFLLRFSLLLGNFKMGKKQSKWDNKANIIGRLVISPSARPGLYDWLLANYGNGDRVKGKDVLDALEDLKGMKDAISETGSRKGI